MSRASTERHHDIEGYSGCKGVVDSNIMATRCALLMLLIEALDLWWLLEQPSTSILMDWPSMQYVKSITNDWAEAKTYLLQYGAPSEKCINVYSNRWWAFALARRRPAIVAGRNSGLVSTKRRDDGSNAVTGNASLLKGSQAYPDGFGQYFFRVWTAYAVNLARKPSLCVAPSELQVRDISHTAWAHLNIAPIMHYIRS